MGRAMSLVALLTVSVRSPNGELLFYSPTRHLASSLAM
jgi:hypothetical protein